MSGSDRELRSRQEYRHRITVRRSDITNLRHCRYCFWDEVWLMKANQAAIITKHAALHIHQWHVTSAALSLTDLLCCTARYVRL